MRVDENGRKISVYFLMSKCQHRLKILKRKIVIATRYNNPTPRKISDIRRNKKKIIICMNYEWTHKIHSECRHARTHLICLEWVRMCVRSVRLYNSIRCKREEANNKWKKMRIRRQHDPTNKCIENHIHSNSIDQCAIWKEERKESTMRDRIYILQSIRRIFVSRQAEAEHTKRVYIHIYKFQFVWVRFFWLAITINLIRNAYFFRLLSVYLIPCFQQSFEPHDSFHTYIHELSNACMLATFICLMLKVWFSILVYCHI